MFQFSNDAQRLIAKYATQYDKLLDVCICDDEKKIILLKKEFHENDNIESFVVDLLISCAKKQVSFYRYTISISPYCGKEKMFLLLARFHRINNSEPMKTSQFILLADSVNRSKAENT